MTAWHEATMTDGPFRNADLPSTWRNYGEDLVSDAVSLEERTMRACLGLLGDAKLSTFCKLLGALAKYAKLPQMELTPITSIETIFEGYEKSPLTDLLQKHISAGLRARISPDEALTRALAGAVRAWIGIAKDRLDEECIRARDLGDMSRASYAKALERNRETFAAIDLAELCDALTSGEKRAFKQALRNGRGVDEGPDE